MQINLTGFFESKTQEFLLNLWKLLLSAQESVGGIPASFLEAKKEQIRQQQASVWLIRICYSPLLFSPLLINTVMDEISSRMKRLSDSRRMSWTIFESVEMQKRKTGELSEIPTDEEEIVTDMMYVRLLLRFMVWKLF